MPIGYPAFSLDLLIRLFRLLTVVACVVACGESAVEAEPTSEAEPAYRYWDTGGYPVAVLVEGLYAYVVHASTAYGPGFVTRNGPDGNVVDTLVRDVSGLRDACVVADLLYVTNDDGVASYALVDGVQRATYPLSGSAGICGGLDGGVYVSTHPTGEIWRVGPDTTPVIIARDLGGSVGMGYDESTRSLYATTEADPDGMNGVRVLIGSSSPAVRLAGLAGTFAGLVAREGLLFLTESKSGDESINRMVLYRPADSTILVARPLPGAAGEVGLLGGDLLLVPIPSQGRVYIMRLSIPEQ